MGEALEKRTFLVEAGDKGQRLDAYLARHAKDLSRTRLKALIKDGHVRLAGKAIRDPNARVPEGATLALTIPEAEAAEPRAETIPLNILFEDRDLIVIDKPPGLVVHP